MLLNACFYQKIHFFFSMNLFLTPTVLNHFGRDNTPYLFFGP